MKYIDAVLFFIGSTASIDFGHFVSAYIAKVNGVPYVREKMSDGLGWFITTITILLIIF